MEGGTAERVIGLENLQWPPGAIVSKATEGLTSFLVQDAHVPMVYLSVSLPGCVCVCCVCVVCVCVLGGAGVGAHRSTPVYARTWGFVKRVDRSYLKKQAVF